ncbi:MAG: CBS domain-containing protein, partial [Bacillota bacterium]|nr:CBS domain-containing protein [Bacillota bacterium]
MIIEEIMKTAVATLGLNNTIADAVKLMDQNKIRHIPIVNS